MITTQLFESFLANCFQLHGVCAENLNLPSHINDTVQFQKHFQSILGRCKLSYAFLFIPSVHLAQYTTPKQAHIADLALANQTKLWEKLKLSNTVTQNPHAQEHRQTQLLLWVCTHTPSKIHLLVCNWWCLYSTNRIQRRDQKSLGGIS